MTSGVNLSTVHGQQSIGVNRESHINKNIIQCGLKIIILLSKLFIIYLFYLFPFYFHRVALSVDKLALSVDKLCPHRRR